MGFTGLGVVEPPDKHPGQCASGWRCVAWNSDGTCEIWKCDQEEAGPVIPIPHPDPPPPPPSGGGGGVADDLPPAVPIAQFTYRVLDDGNVEFTNKSINYYERCYWTFGDGKSSTLSNPVHKYSITGNYTVTLKAYGGGSYDSESQEITVVDNISEVNFSYIASGLNLAFTNLSTIIGTIIWEFGDGDYGSDDSPFHSYDEAGTYPVRLWIGDRYKTVSIVVSEGGGTGCNSLEPSIEETLATNYGQEHSFARTTYFYHLFKPGEGGSDYYKIRRYNSAVSSLDAEITTDILGPDTAPRSFIATSNRYYIGNLGVRGAYPILEIRIYNSSGTLLDNFGLTETESLWSDLLASYDIRFAIDETGGRIYILITSWTVSPTTDSEVRLYSLDLDGNVFEDCIDGILVAEECNVLDIKFYGDKLYIFDATGTIYVHDPDDGSLIDEYSFGVSEYLESSFMVANDRIFITDYPDYPEETPGYIRLYDLTMNLITCFQPNPLNFFGELSANGTYIYNFALGSSLVEGYPVTYNEPMSGESVDEPIALFTADVYSGMAPLEVTFTDASYGDPTEYLWEFGDGETETFASGSHTFLTAGIYRVRLTITNSLGSDSYERVIMVYDHYEIDEDISYYIRVGDYYYGIDSANHRICIYNLSWALQGCFGSEYLDDPTYLVAFGDCILVIDRENHNIRIFDLEGNLESTYGEYGIGDGQFNSPFGIGTNGIYVYVADTGNKRIQIFSFDENTCSILAYIGQIALDYEPYGISFDDNFMYVIDKAKCLLNVYTFSGELIRSYPIPCGYEYVKFEDGFVVMWGEDEEDGSNAWPINPDFLNPENYNDDSIEFVNSISGFEPKRLLIQMNILNPSNEELLMPLQLTMDIMQYLQPLILTMNILPDVFTEYKKIPQVPTDEINYE